MDAFEATHGRPADVVLLVQCTSPFLSSAEVAETVERITSGAADTAFTAAPSHGFLWRETVEDGATGVNHDKAHRPRRQDREPEYLETGAVYAMDGAGFRTHRHRFFGRTALVVTDPARVLEIDDPHDLARARVLAPLLDTPATPASRTSTPSSSTSTARRPTTGSTWTRRDASSSPRTAATASASPPCAARDCPSSSSPPSRTPSSPPAPASSRSPSCTASTARTGPSRSGARRRASTRSACSTPETTSTTFRASTSSAGPSR